MKQHGGGSIFSAYAVILSVAFSIDPDTGNRNVGVVQAVYGLGEMIVQGKETADRV